MGITLHAPDHRFMVETLPACALGNHLTRINVISVSFAILLPVVDMQMLLAVRFCRVAPT
jgi:hypothetical protein